jgi:hypothetical protein
MGRPSYMDIIIQQTKDTIQSIKIGGSSVIIGLGQIFLDM